MWKLEETSGLRGKPEMKDLEVVGARGSGLRFGSRLCVGNSVDGGTEKDVMVFEMLRVILVLRLVLGICGPLGLKACVAALSWARDEVQHLVSRGRYSWARQQ